MFIGLAMVPVFIFYFLDEKSGIQKGWTNYLPIQESKFKYELVFCLNAIKDYLIVFFRGQILVAMCLGVLYSIGFSVVNLNYALLLGTLAGMLSIVPYLGAILTIVPAVILAAVQHNDWKHPILVVIVFAVVQSLEGLLISPKIMGDRVGLHPFTIIVAVLVGTTLLGGILGGLLAIPLTAALRVLMFRYVWRKPGEVVSKS
jgi:predicted PurR-regulated permease PerM